jgi:hypothetical protein
MTIMPFVDARDLLERFEEANRIIAGQNRLLDALFRQLESDPKTHVIVSFEENCK